MCACTATLRTPAQAAGAAVAAVAVGAAAYKANQARGSAAAVELHNLLGAAEDPANLTADQVGSAATRSLPFVNPHQTSRLGESFFH